MSKKPTSQTTFTPPDTWQQKSAFGFMAHDGTPAGRLVRLADVLRWVSEHPSPKPHTVAVDAFIDALPGDVMKWLYRVTPNGYATPVALDYSFGYKTAAQIEADKAKAIQDAIWRDHKNTRFISDGMPVPGTVNNGKISIKPPEPTVPGLPALQKHLRAMWRVESSVDHAKAFATYLAIPFDKAAKHWGWGVVPAANAGETTNAVAKDVALLALFDAYEKRGNLTAEKFAEKQGISFANLKKRLGQARELKKKNASNPFATLAVVGGKKVSKK